MDPLSVTASILTILSAVNGGIKVAQTFYNAPRELDSLATEAEDFSNVIKDIRTLPETDLVSNSLSPALSRGKIILQELEELIAYRLTKTSSVLHVDRLGWARHRPQVKDLRKQLKNVRLSLVASLGALTSITTHETRKSLTDVVTFQSQMQLQQQQLSNMLVELQLTLGNMQAQMMLTTLSSINLQQAYPSALSSANVPDLSGNPKPWLRDSPTLFALPDDMPWILNLSMRFRDGQEREKFFVTYAETPSVWKRITITCDYRNAPDNSMEKQLMNKEFQRDKAALIWSVVKESMIDIQMYDTVTNLRIQTMDDRLHLYATEDVNEIIPYPPIDRIKHINCPHYKESQVEINNHLNGFAYMVTMGGENLVRKDIPGPDSVDEFLNELYMLSKLQASLHVVTLKGIVVDDKGRVVKGFMMEYAEGGALVDILFDYKGKIPWLERENWAYQVVKGISELHTEGLPIGSLTLSKLVIDAENIVKLCSLRKEGCAVGWEPPEISDLIAQGQRISSHLGLKTDLYQMGVILWALAADEDQPERRPGPLTLGDDIPQYYRALVGICLSQQPRDRMWASEILRMFPWSVARSAVTLRNGPKHQVEAPTS